MSSYWQEFSPITKFSIVAFFVSGFLGLFSMGALGMLLHYPVAFVTKPFFGAMNTWSGDWVWPSSIMVGMLWSFGFLIASVIIFYLAKYQLSIWLIRLIYVGVLWTWALCLWLIFLSRKM